MLDELGPLLMKDAGLDHVTVDLVLAAAGQSRTFLDVAPLRRIGGDDDFFKSKHKAYVNVEPLLGEVD